MGPWTAAAGATPRRGCDPSQTREVVRLLLRGRLPPGPRRPRRRLLPQWHPPLPMNRSRHRLTGSSAPSFGTKTAAHARIRRRAAQGACSRPQCRPEAAAACARIRGQRSDARAPRRGHAPRIRAPACSVPARGGRPHRRGAWGWSTRGTHSGCGARDPGTRCARPQAVTRPACAGPPQSNAPAVLVRAEVVGSARVPQQAAAVWVGGGCREVGPVSKALMHRRSRQSDQTSHRRWQAIESTTVRQCSATESSDAILLNDHLLLVRWKLPRAVWATSPSRRRIRAKMERLSEAPAQRS